MNTQTKMTTEFHPFVATIQGVAKTTSFKIAEHYGKRHADVLRAISNLEASKEFIEQAFALSEYLDATGRRLPYYQMTRDGFMFLVMGFTGKEAAKWKEAYIAAFNRMESELLKALHGKHPSRYTGH